MRNAVGSIKRNKPKMNKNNFGVSLIDDGYTPERSIAIAQMQDKMIANFWNGNVAASVDDIKDVKEMIAGLAEDLKFTIKFFNSEHKVEAPKKRISKKEQERLDFEAYETRLEIKALNSIKNGG